MCGTGSRSSSSSLCLTSTSRHGTRGLWRDSYRKKRKTDMRNVGATAGVQSLPQACVICSRAFTVTARERHHINPRAGRPDPLPGLPPKEEEMKRFFEVLEKWKTRISRPGPTRMRKGCHPVSEREGASLTLLLPGFRQCGSFVEVCAVARGCVLSRVRGLVLVRGGGTCRAVGGGMRSRAALVDVCLDVVPLPPSSSSPTVAGCWLGGYPGRDRSGGKRVVGGMIPRINIGADAWGESSIMTGIYQRWCSSTLHIGWGLRDRVCLVLVCRGRYGLGRGRYGLGGGGNKHTRVVLLFILGSN